jgi:carbon storage regulator
MLVLSRKKNEEVVCADGIIVVRVIEIRGDKVRLGFEAASDISIHRREVWNAIQIQQSRGVDPGTGGVIPPVHAPGPDHGAQLDTGTVGPNPQDDVHLGMGGVPDA